MWRAVKLVFVQLTCCHLNWVAVNRVGGSRASTCHRKTGRARSVTGSLITEHWHSGQEAAFIDRTCLSFTFSLSLSFFPFLPLPFVSRLKLANGEEWRTVHFYWDSALGTASVKSIYTLLCKYTVVVPVAAIVSVPVISLIVMMISWADCLHCHTPISRKSSGWWHCCRGVRCKAAQRRQMMHSAMCFVLLLLDCYDFKIKCSAW